MWHALPGDAFAQCLFAMQLVLRNVSKIGSNDETQEEYHRYGKQPWVNILLPQKLHQRHTTHCRKQDENENGCIEQMEERVSLQPEWKISLYIPASMARC